MLSWTDSLNLACDWTIDVSMIATREHGLDDGGRALLGQYDDWRGAFRGEYSARTRQWGMFCPIWHGGQAVKALALAYEVLGQERLIDAARAGAEFILRNQVEGGMIRAYESGQDGINTSATIECLDGLFELSRVTGEAKWAQAAIDAARWLQRNAFLPEEGFFKDEYLPEADQFQRPAWAESMGFLEAGRPLLDDGVFITAAQVSGDASLADVAIRTADRLLKDEAPEGTWAHYPPALARTGVIHPRHSYWWGRPMWKVNQATGDQRYLDCCRRSATWYVKAMREDGGLFRNTDANFNTPSFGQATSGIACAAILWHELAREYGDTEWDEPLLRGLRFCRGVQFSTPTDPNLRGAILEKVVTPDGTDAPPWYLRDVGTFFYIQAVALVLRDRPAFLADSNDDAQWGGTFWAR
ncbi:MAG: hypothetical protein HQ523_04335 [Lentisphaerae bacterium]|nr:hypothetical protein [Lentisphaerota bacterium]